MRSFRSSSSSPLDLLPTAAAPPATSSHDRQMRDHVARVADLLAATEIAPVWSLPTEDMLVELADLATIARLVNELLHQARGQFADWLPVDAHLRQAQAHAADVHRCLNHACATFAFATLPATA